MKKIYTILAAFAAMSLLFSCEKEMSDVNNYPKGLGVEVNETAPEDVMTKSAEEVGVPYLMQVNGDTLYVTESVSDMPIEVSSADTKGIPISEVGTYFNSFYLYLRNTEDNDIYEDPNGVKVDPYVTAKYTDNKWSLYNDDNTYSSIYWPNDKTTKLNFYASNSMSTGTNQTVSESFLADGGMQISYKDSGSEDASTGANDLLYAWALKSRQQSEDEGGWSSDDPDYTKIGLTFHHLLAGIKFQFGDITNGLTLTGVTLNNIKNSGTCVYKNDEFSWTTSETTSSMSIQYGTTTADGVTDCDNSTDGSKKFFVMPQDISDDASMTFTFEYDPSAYSSYQSYKDTYPNGEKLVIKKTLKFKDLSSSVTSWEAGKMYIYTLSGNVVFAELGMTMWQITNSLGVVSNSYVTAIEFCTNDKTTTDLTVQSDKSLTPIYAKLDGTKLVLYTAASKIYAKPDSDYLFGVTTNAMYEMLHVLRPADAIGYEPFTNPFSSLTTITNLSCLDTRNVTSMEYMFAGCTKLTDIDVSHFNTENVKGMDYMFVGCESVKSLDLSNFDTSKIPSLSGTFMGCSALETLDVSKFNTSSVKDMFATFMGCKSLTSLDLSSFDTSNNTNFEYTFGLCSSLSELNVSKFNTSKATLMDGMFYECESLTSLDVTNFDTSKVTTMEIMFGDCKKLTSIDVSKFNTGSCIRFGSMFVDCESLTSLDVSTFDSAKGEIFYEMFKGCTSLKTVNVTGLVTSKATDIFGMFKECSSLTSIVGLNTFNTSNVEDMRWMFNICTSLPSVDLSSFNTSKVTDMESMFSGCTALTTLDVTNFDTSSVENMADMFRTCSKLTSLDLSNFNTANVTDMENMFMQCLRMYELKLGANFTVPTGTTSGTTDKHLGNLNMLKDFNSTSATQAAHITCTSAAKTALTSTVAGINSPNVDSWTWTVTDADSASE